jgi:predicted PurR-regulated permease PerM
MPSTPNAFKRNKALFLFLIGIFIVGALMYALREPLLPFFIGFAIAYLLLPPIDWIDKRLPFQERGHEIQRIIIILVTFLIILTLIGLTFSLVLPSFINSFSHLFVNAPTLVINGLDTLGSWMESMVRTLTPEQQKPAHDIVNNIGASIGNWLQGTLMSSLEFIPSTLPFVVGCLTLPFFLILFMANVHNLHKGFYALFPTEVAYHVHNFFEILDKVFGRYVRAQILLAIVMGSLVYIALLFIGIEMAPSLAFVAGIFQLVPVIGGALAAIIGIIITLAIAPAQVIWVLIAYLIINLAIGSVLIARVHSRAVDIDASIVMILIIIGGYLAGIIGMILITPAVAIAFALYKYAIKEMERFHIEQGRSGKYN